MFVDDDGHLLITTLHFLQQIRTAFGLGNKQRGPGQLAPRPAPRFLFRHLQQITPEGHADDIIKRVFVHRNARKSGLNQELPELLDCGIRGDGNHIRARRHEFQNALIAEFNNLLDHLGFGTLEDSFLLSRVDQRFNSLLL